MSPAGISRPQDEDLSVASPVIPPSWVCRSHDAVPRELLNLETPFNQLLPLRLIRTDPQALIPATVGGIQRDPPQKLSGHGVPLLRSRSRVRLLAAAAASRWGRNAKTRAYLDLGGKIILEPPTIRRASYQIVVSAR